MSLLELQTGQVELGQLTNLAQFFFSGQVGLGWFNNLIQPMIQNYNGSIRLNGQSDQIS